MKTELLYNGFLKIHKLETSIGDREICIRPDAVACLIYDDENVLLTHQLRVGALYNNFNHIFYEVPAGMIDENESAINAVIREIKEETGIELNSKLIDSHGYYYPSPGGLSERIHLFSAKVNDLHSITMKPQNDKYENILLYIINRNKVITQDMKTALLLEKIKNVNGENKNG